MKQPKLFNFHRLNLFLVCCPWGPRSSGPLGGWWGGAPPRGRGRTRRCWRRSSKRGCLRCNPPLHRTRHLAPFKYNKIIDFSESPPPPPPHTSVQVIVRFLKKAYSGVSDGYPDDKDRHEGGSNLPDLVAYPMATPMTRTTTRVTAIYLILCCIRWLPWLWGPPRSWQQSTWSYGVPDGNPDDEDHHEGGSNLPDHVAYPMATPMTRTATRVAAIYLILWRTRWLPRWRGPPRGWRQPPTRSPPDPVPSSQPGI